MRKLAFAAVPAALVACSVAFAAAVPDTITATATATKGGTKAKPKVVAAGFVATATGPDSTRAITPSTLRWSWDGISTNGAAFPKCSVDTIDADQSDTDCPPKALVGTGKIEAILGGEQDRVMGVPCNRDINIYSNGKGKATLFLYGDPSDCAGVQYLPPIELTTKKTSTGESIGFIVPDNVSHPLPGLEGAISRLEINFKKVSIKKGKKKVGYLTSKGCKSTRNFTFTQEYPNGSFDDAVSTASAGGC